jgi:hypothetical protein
MAELSTIEVIDIAAGVYALETQGVSEAYKAKRNERFLGCEGLFKVHDSSRFEGVSGGHFRPYLSGFGYIAEGEGNRQGEVLIATRGTQGLRDWITDFRAGWSWSESSHPVHHGFNQVWQSFSNDIKAFLRGKNPTHVHCVGHSLGGALATLNADYISANGIAKVSLYTIGSPRVGVRSFADCLTERIGAQNIYKIGNRSDPVTMVPIYPFFHVPFRGQTYTVGSPILPINPLAHKMVSYVRATRNATWSSLVEAPTTLILADEVNRWLETVKSGGGIIAFSTETLSMIGKVLSWVLHEALKQGGIELTNGLTAMDQLGYMCERGVKLSRELEEKVKTVLNAILRFIGRSAIVITNVTVAFVHYVLELFFSTVQMMAVQAVSAARRQE